MPESTFTTNIDTIRTAIYGRDVREAIASAMEECYSYAERADDMADDATEAREAIESVLQLDYTKRTAITSGADLNECVTAGNFPILTQAIANSLSNSPSKAAGMLVVMTITAANSHTVLLQIYIEYTGLIYTRSRTGASEVWGEWIRQMDSRDTTLHRAVPVGEHYELIANEFTKGKWTNGAYEDAGWAYTKAKLNHGSIIEFDPSLYQVMYLVLDAATESTQLVQNEGFSSSGRIVVNTQGISDDYIVVVEARPASGSGSVDIYGTGNTIRILNRDKMVDLFLFAGQSNMAGRGTANQAPVVLPEAGFEFRAVTAPTRLYPIVEPFGVAENNADGINDGSLKTGSMVSAFVNTYYERTGVPVIAVSASNGGTAMSSWLPSGTLLPDALSRMSAAKTYLSGKGYSVRHTYMLWCQGETDGSTASSDDDEAYISNFGTMWGACKTAGVEKCFLVRIGNLNSSSGSYALMIEQQTLLAKMNPDVVMATTLLSSYKARNMMKDEYHYIQAAYNEMGSDAAAHVAEYVNTGVEPTMYDPEYGCLYYPAYPETDVVADQGVATIAETLAYLGIN